MYPSRQHASLPAIVQQFLAAHALPVDVAGFAVAGPVRNGRSEAVNLAWACRSWRRCGAAPRCP
jgi:glucokinase